MATWYQSLSVIHDEGNHRFEIHLSDTETALLAYIPRGRQLDLVHTEVPPPWERRGIAELLVRAALDYAREQELTIIPSCPYVQAFLRRHPEYGPLSAARS